MDINKAIEKPIRLNVWKSNPKIFLQNMPDNGYNAEINAVELAKIFAMAVPGSTLDIFYNAIAKEVLKMLDTPEHIEILKSPYDIENRIRIALNELIESSLTLDK